ncbi:MAG: heavy-metal-associated domain-containing protein [Bacteriovoracaceae bacterium]|nr:heavy-metal-associated domain-containing protein [Bacteriovoracaceae bacterium]
MLNLILLFASLTYANMYEVHVDKMSCVSCAQTITTELKKNDKVVSTKMTQFNPPTGVVILETKSQTDISDAEITKTIQSLNYAVTKIVRK